MGTDESTPLPKNQKVGETGIHQLKSNMYGAMYESTLICLHVWYIVMSHDQNVFHAIRDMGLRDMGVVLDCIDS